jgi:hypothetical protein
MEQKAFVQQRVARRRYRNVLILYVDAGPHEKRRDEDVIGAVRLPKRYRGTQYLQKYSHADEGDQTGLSEVHPDAPNKGTVKERCVGGILREFKALTTRETP